MPASLPRPSPPLARLGRFTARHRWAVIAAGLVALIAAAVVGAPVIGQLSLNRYSAPGSESDRVAVALDRTFGTGSPDLALLATVEDGTVDDPAVREAGRDLHERLAAADGVADVRSYWNGDGATLRSDDGTSALLLARLPGDADHVRGDVLPRLASEFEGDGGAGITVGLGGSEELFRQVAAESSADFVRAEMIIFPVLFVLLVIVLRGLALPLVPLVLGVFTIAATLAVFRVVTLSTDLSTFALNITLVMGMALGVDYCLFVIFRFREELRAGRSTEDAVAETLRTAGRTVLFSGATVAVAFAALFALPFDFLRSFGYAGITVVLFGMVAALVLLPAVLAAFGPRAARGVFLRPGAARPAGTGFWHATAGRVMARPMRYGGAVLALLLVLAAPVLGIRFGLPDERVLPESAEARQVSERIREDFTAEEGDAVQVVTEMAPGDDRVAAYAAGLSRIDGVVHVDSAAGTFTDGARTAAPGAGTARFGAANAGTTWLSVVPSVAALESAPFALVQEVRAAPAPAPAEVGGYPAELLDYRDGVTDRLPLVVGLILGLSFVLLFLLSGGLLLPLKATVLNVLSLAVMFGVLVWGFQDGNLSGPLGFTAAGTLETNIPLLMFCIAYGLSMDYEVFMMARIKEEYDRTGDTAAAVAAGLQRSGPLISAAGAILAASFLAYATSGVVLLQMLGVGLALAILVDATLIRAVLVPAFMRVAGRANWWAPPPLRRLHARIGLSESGPPPAPADVHRAPARSAG
ncbi:MMPL family transporter [Nocardiopsis mangrovi]|uniref:MMPL family transporter n=1 Tax=Nocardiopsis mangrovi TaxID=1179818 RepID=A0ABV9DYI6_9ACTN